MSYWKANPHAFGPGKTHKIHPDGTKTLCGTRLSNCPGRYVPEVEYTCKTCARVVATEGERQQREQEWQRRQREFEIRKNQQRSQYHDYLASPQWQRIRASVIAREHGLCEGCRRRPATEVHHLNYDHIFDELLYELKALCRECHEKTRKPAELGL